MSEKTTKSLIEDLRHLRGNETSNLQFYEAIVEKTTRDHERELERLQQQYEDRQEALQEHIDALKAVLATREHVPNKDERKVMRQERAKEGKTHDKRRR